MMIFTDTEQQISFESASGFLDILLMGMLILVAGYGFYTAIRLKKTYMLFPNKFLYPSGCTAETCLDEGAYIDSSKTKEGYEIPFTKLFYKFIPPTPSKEIFSDLKEMEKEEISLMKELFSND